jgi:hypothetical protein
MVKRINESVIWHDWTTPNNRKTPDTSNVQQRSRIPKKLAWAWIVLLLALWASKYFKGNPQWSYIEKYSEEPAYTPEGDHYPQAIFDQEYLRRCSREAIDEVFQCPTILMWDRSFKCSSSFNWGRTKMVPVISTCTQKPVCVVYVDSENGAIEYTEMCTNTGAIWTRDCLPRPSDHRFIWDACCEALTSLFKSKNFKSAVRKWLQSRWK